MGIGTGLNNRNSGIEVRNTGEVYLNYTQIDEDDPKQTAFAACRNINTVTYPDQTRPEGVKIKYMSIQDIIDWLACRINNLYDNVATTDTVDVLTNKITTLETKNAALEARIAELENIISQITIQKE